MGFVATNARIGRSRAQPSRELFYIRGAGIYLLHQLQQLTLNRKLNNGR
jgi:hypothetical protein